MFKPNDPLRGAAGKRGRILAGVGAVVAVAAAAAALVQMPLGAFAGIAPGSVERASQPARPPAVATRAASTYQLRCWQYGRLLFDEGPVTLGPDAKQGARFVATDRNGGALIVTDNGVTTCLARPSQPAPSLALPH